MTDAIWDHICTLIELEERTNASQFTVIQRQNV